MFETETSAPNSAPGSHCSSCGTLYGEGVSGWPRTCPACGTVAYRNPLPVAVALQPVYDTQGTALVVITRTVAPARGGVALPGGYVDDREDWRQAVVRELKEETGIDAASRDVRLVDAMSSPDGHLLLFGLLPERSAEGLPAVRRHARDRGMAPAAQGRGTRLPPSHPSRAGLVRGPLHLSRALHEPTDTDRAGRLAHAVLALPLHDHPTPPNARRTARSPVPPSRRPRPARPDHRRSAPRGRPHLQHRPAVLPAHRKHGPARANTGIRARGASTRTCAGPSYARSVTTSYQRPRGSCTARRSAPGSSTGATSRQSPSRKASSQSRNARSSGVDHHSGRTYGAPVRRARCASVTKYGSSRRRSTSATRACSSTSAPNPTAPRACGTTGRWAASCNHRRYSSGDGPPPAPPTSGPAYGTPHNPSPITSDNDARSPGHPVATFPDHAPP